MYTFIVSVALGLYLSSWMTLFHALIVWSLMAAYIEYALHYEEFLVKLSVLPEEKQKHPKRKFFIIEISSALGASFLYGCISHAAKMFFM